MQEGSIVDSTTIQVRDVRVEECPGTGDFAALNGHKLLSVSDGAPVRSPLSPAWDHDRPHRQINDSGRGYGRLADLADVSLTRLRVCDTHDVRVVIRLQDHWPPKGDDIARGQVTRAGFPGTDLNALLQEDTLVLDGRAIDADVRVVGGMSPLHLRLVGVQTPEGSCVFLTHVPPRIGPCRSPTRTGDAERWNAA